MTETLDLRGTLLALRRRWLWLTSILLLGFALGAVFAFRKPPSYEARSGVLLPPATVDSTGKPLRNILTEVQVADSAAVLSRAAVNVHPRPSLRTLRAAVNVRAASPDILDIRVDASSARRAAQIADAVATAYVDYATGSASENADVQVSALRAQASELNNRIVGLQNDITAATARLGALDQRSAEGLRQATVLDELRVSQVEASTELSTLNARIAEVQLSADLNRRGIRVLNTAIPPRTPSRKKVLITVGFGTLAGLILGVIVALARERGDARLRTRADIAQAVGAPVLFSMAVAPRPRDSHVRAAYSRWHPNAAEQWGLSQAAIRLAAPSIGPLNIVVGALPGDVAAAVFAVHLAVSIADTGDTTALLIGGNGSTTSMIRAACVAESRLAVETARKPSVFSVQERHEGDLEPFMVTVTLLADVATPLQLPTWRRDTIATLATSAGFATSEQLASAALAFFDAGYPIRGVFVVNPDSTDRTTGHDVQPPSRPGTCVVVPGPELGAVTATSTHHEVGPGDG